MIKIRQNCQKHLFPKSGTDSLLILASTHELSWASALVIKYNYKIYGGHI